MQLAKAAAHRKHMSLHDYQLKQVLCFSNVSICCNTPILRQLLLRPHLASCAYGTYGLIQLGSLQCLLA